MNARVDKARYLSPAWAEAERARLWPTVWLHAAHEDLLDAPGRHVTTTVGGADVLLVRGADGVLRAFHNVCQHRGRRLVDAPCGQADALRCPLHHWLYRLDGRLADVPERAAFAGLIDDDTRLASLACAVWRRHVFVHLGEPRESLDAWLAPLEARLAPYELDRYALVDRKTFSLPCNWKTVADLFNEAYHVPAVHPYLLGSVDPRSVRAEVHGPHVEQTFAIARPATSESPSAVTESLTELVRDVGADPASLQGDARNAPALMRAALRARGVEALSDDALLEGKSWFLFPSTTLNVYAHGAQLHRHRPHPHDPERCWLDQLTFTRPAPGERAPTPRVSFHERPADEDSGRVTEDDLRQAIATQRGMRSPGFEALRLGARETALAHMHETLERWLA